MFGVELGQKGHYYELLEARCLRKKRGCFGLWFFAIGKGLDLEIVFE